MAGGWVSGNVIDSVYGTPIVGALVSISTPSGVCGNCTVNATPTNGTGYFRVEGDPGPVVLTYSDLDYLGNRSFANVTSGVVTPVGNVRMVHLATVVGTVVADLPGLPPVAGANLSSESRDGALGGPDQTLSLSNGTFSLEVDPIAIEVQVDRPGRDPSSWRTPPSPPPPLGPS